MHLIQSCSCGEDEHPLNELLILQLGVDYANGLYKMPFYKTSGNQCNQERKRFLREAENGLVGDSYKINTFYSISNFLM